MKRLNICFLVFILWSCGDAVKQKEYIAPDKLYPVLFEEVQKSGIFLSSKVFADAIPKEKPEIINELFKTEKKKTDFKLKNFISYHFVVKDTQQNIFVKNDTFSTFLEKNLISLIRKPKDDGGSLVPPRKEYISGGHSFDEFSYWTTYANFLSLNKLGQSENAENLIANCAQFIESFGHVPSGNRSYMLDRSSFPVFVLLLNETRNNEVLLKYLPQLNREYQYWMSIESKDDQKIVQNNLKKGIAAYKKSVNVSPNDVLNRFFDEKSDPRPEYYTLDLKYKTNTTIISNIRTAEQSCWPQNARWLKDQSLESSINANDILPVDLNAILYVYEKTLSKAYNLKSKPDYAKAFDNLALKRKKLFNKYFWNEKEGYYTDFDFVNKKSTEVVTLAGLLPLLTDIPDAEQKKLIIENARKYFLNSKGLSLYKNSNESSPEWLLLAIKSLESGGGTALANQVKNLWLRSNQIYFNKSKEILLGGNKKTSTNRIDGALSVLIYFNN